MGSGASVDDFNERAYHYADSTIKPRMICSLDFAAMTISCTRAIPLENFHALSHRWQNRTDNTIWQVYVDDEAPYECKLTLEEANNLQLYLDSYGPGLWLDYVCIDQSSADDKNAQVSIMGQIYLGCCTLVVGPNLSPRMPPEDYIYRAWCIQERMFGSIKFPWDFNHCDSLQLQLFAEAMIWRIPHLGAALKIIDDYDYTEGWRVDGLHAAAHTYPHVRNEILQMIELMQYNRDKKALSVLALKVREKIPCIHDVEDPAWPGKWGMQMFTCDSSYVKDRLYGVWGVSMYMKGIVLPYDNERHAFKLVKLFYPSAEFASYCTVPDDIATAGKINWSSKSLVSGNTFHDTSTVLHGVLSGDVDAILNAKPISDATYYHVLATGLRFVVALSNVSVGFGWHHNDNGGISDPASIPMYLVMPRSLVRDYQDGRPHYSVIGFCNMVSTKGCPIEWNTSYDLWAKVKTILRKHRGGH